MYRSMRHKLKLSTFVTTGVSCLLRRISTATATASPQYPPANPLKIQKWDLYSKLSSVGSTGQKVTDVLQQLSESGTQFYTGDLVYCLKKLRKYGRNHHCLEILDWVEKGVVDHSYYALRLDLICKVKGIDEAEKYFDSIPPDMKKPPLYGSLLNCYCFKNMTDEALALFEKMKEMNCAFNCLPFNNLMGLYVKLNQPEKVPPLIQEMKQRNIPLNSVSYQNWIHCHGLLNDLAGLERVVDEVEGQSSVVGDWRIYSSVASAYIKAGQCERAAQAMQKMENIVANSRDIDRIAYHHMISLYASIGSSKSVSQAWDELNRKFTMCQNQSYAVMLQALSKLDDIEGLRKCLKEWTERCKSYDVRLPNTALGAYLKHDLLDEAELLVKDVENRCTETQKPSISHVIFMDYYLGKRQIDLALKHMDSAIANKWEPSAEKILPFFDYFKEERDVDGAEELLSMLNKVQLVDSRAYLWLLQTYAAAGITAPDLRQRMEKDNVSISTEHEELLNMVCPRPQAE